MQKFLSMLFSRRALAIVGVVMLALRFCAWLSALSHRCWLSVMFIHLRRCGCV